MKELSEEQLIEHYAHMEKLQEHLNNAFEHIELAQTELFLKSNVFSDCMDLKQFNELIVELLREMM